MTVPNLSSSILWFMLPGALCFAYALGLFLAEVTR